MKIYISTDHAGYELKEYLVEKLQKSDYEVIDWGPEEFDKKDDYPKTTEKVVRFISENPKEKAILICKNGVGVNIFANKWENVRAGLSWNKKHAKSHKNDDHTNILTLPAGYITSKKALEITKTWLKTKPGQKKRHKRRIKQIEILSK